MNTIAILFGEGKNLNALQMGMRALVVFVIALTLIRIAGRRSFGQRAAFDYVVAILLGATLSRTIVGASPFLATVMASIVIVVLHRLVAWLCMHSRALERLVVGAAVFAARVRPVGRRGCLAMGGVPVLAGARRDRNQAWRARGSTFAGHEALAHQHAQPLPVDQVTQAHLGMLQVDLLAQRLPEEISLSYRRLWIHLHLTRNCRIHASICQVPAIPTTPFRTQSATVEGSADCSGPTSMGSKLSRTVQLRWTSSDHTKTP